MVLDMDDNVVGFFKSLGAGVIFSAIIGLVFWLIYGKYFTYEEIFLFIAPMVFGGGLMMGFSVWGAEQGLGRIGLFVYVLAYLAPFIYSVIMAIVQSNIEFLIIPGTLSVAFFLFYISFGLGEFNPWLTFGGGGSILALLLVFSLVSGANEIAGAIVSIALFAIAIIVVLVFRKTKGSVLDV